MSARACAGCEGGSVGGVLAAGRLNSRVRPECKLTWTAAISRSLDESDLAGVVHHDLRLAIVRRHGSSHADRLLAIRGRGDDADPPVLLDPDRTDEGIEVGGIPVIRCGV